MLSLACCQLYIGIIVRKYIYDDEIDKQLLVTVIGFTLQNMILAIISYMIIMWVGSKYVEAELPRLGNEKLLNGLKEGVFITEEESGIIKFKNKAATRLVSEFKDGFDISMIDERNVF